MKDKDSCSNAVAGAANGGRALLPLQSHVVEPDLARALEDGERQEALRTLQGIHLDADFRPVLGAHQLRANTLRGIERAYKGKVCVTVDLDRQGFPFDAPARIRDEICQVVDALAEPEGGLMLGAGVWGGDVPLANVEAICQAMEECCFP